MYVPVMGEPARQPLRVLPFAAAAELFGVVAVWPGSCPGDVLLGLWLGVVWLGVVWLGVVGVEVCGLVLLVPEGLL